MSLIIASIYVLVGRRLRIEPRSWIARGLAAGAVIFAIMNFIVLPLSAAPHLPAPTAEQFIENVAAMPLFGLFVAYSAREVA